MADETSSDEFQIGEALEVHDCVTIGAGIGSHLATAHSYVFIGGPEQHAARAIEAFAEFALREASA